MIRKFLAIQFEDIEYMRQLPVKQLQKYVAERRHDLLCLLHHIKYLSMPNSPPNLEHILSSPITSELLLFLFNINNKLEH